MSERSGDRSRASFLNPVELRGVLGGVEAARARAPGGGERARFRLWLNWLSPEDDPGGGGARSRSEAALAARLPADRAGFILPVRARAGHEIGCTLELVDLPEHAEEQRRDFELLVGCRVEAEAAVSYFHFTPRPTAEAPAPAEVRGYRLRLRALRAEGVEMRFNELSGAELAQL